MEECLASMFSNLPNEQHEILYSKWAEESDFGLLITGNVQVDPAHLGTPFDVAYQVSPDDSIRIEKIAHRWTSWALSCADTPCLVQLNHPGRQSPRGLKRWPWSPALAPTAIPLSSSDTTVGRLLESSVFGLVKEATRAELRQIVSQFVEAALHVHRSGFQGVQIHCRCVAPCLTCMNFSQTRPLCSHGYLLCQMMSPIVSPTTSLQCGKLIILPARRRTKERTNTEIHPSIAFVCSSKLSTAYVLPARPNSALL